MSLWTKLRDNIIRPAARAVVATYTGGASEALGIGGAITGSRSGAPAAPPPPVGLPGFGAVLGSSLQPLPGVGSALPALRSMNNPSAYVAGAAAGRLVGAAARSAMTYCRRHPAWCSTIGLAGVTSMVQSGQLPPIKRRRGRGISATELKHFRRVSHVLNKWCKTPAPTKPRRSRSCA